MPEIEIQKESQTSVFEDKFTLDSYVKSNIFTEFSGDEHKENIKIGDFNVIFSVREVTDYNDFSRDKDKISLNIEVNYEGSDNIMYYRYSESYSKIKRGGRSFIGNILRLSDPDYTDIQGYIETKVYKSLMKSKKEVKRKSMVTSEVIGAFSEFNNCNN